MNNRKIKVVIQNLSEATISEYSISDNQKIKEILINEYNKGHKIFCGELKKDQKVKNIKDLKAFNPLNQPLNFSLDYFALEPIPYTYEMFPNEESKAEKKSWFSRIFNK